MGSFNRIIKPGCTIALVAAGALLIGAAGCSSSGSAVKSNSKGGSPTTPLTGKSLLPTSQSSMPTFTIDAEMPYKFVLPETTAPSGYVTIKLTNKDKTMDHQAQLVKLRDGVTFAKFKSDLTGPAGPPPYTGSSVVLPPLPLARPRCSSRRFPQGSTSWCASSLTRPRPTFPTS